MIEKKDMFPPPSVFSPDCVIDESISDAVAVSIAKGSFDSSTERTTGNSNIVQCLYKNPDITMTVSHFEDVEECKTIHTEQGIGVSRQLKGFEEIDGIGVDAYVARFGDEHIGFRYGNLSVVASYRDETLRDQVIEALKKHYDSVSD